MQSPGIGRVEKTSTPLTSEDCDVKLTKYLVLLENNYEYPDIQRRSLRGRENAAFNLDLGDDLNDSENPISLTNRTQNQQSEAGNNNDKHVSGITGAEKPAGNGHLASPRRSCVCRFESSNNPNTGIGSVTDDTNIRRTQSHGDVTRLSQKRGTTPPEGDSDAPCGNQHCPWCQDVSRVPRFSLNSTYSAGQQDGCYDDWRLSLDQFTSKRLGEKRKSSGFSKELRSFYKKQDNHVGELENLREEAIKADKSYYKSQDNLIREYEEVRLEDDEAYLENAKKYAGLLKKAATLAKISFAANLLLLVIKVVAVVMSGSISLISSLVDSAVDLVSGIVIWLTSRAVKKTDRYVYPQGRSKLEPIAIVILSTIMSVASLQIIKESFTKIVGLSQGSDSPPLMDWVTLGIASVTVVVKLVLFVFCYRIKHPTVQALAQDHRNDVLSNAVAILFSYIGSQQMQAKVSVTELVYLDPAGAIVISVYIIVMWCITGWDQIKLLVGHTATPEFLSKVTWICMDHHKDIQKVDTVRAFHFGNHFLVEADIVLPPEMTLREAHDIGQPLQQKLERLPTVERAFVHIDYEAVHDPKTEHKVI